MKLHNNKTLFRQAIQFTSDQMNIPAVYVEKDYWVTSTLNTIFSSEIGKDTVFKGGTALSKCYSMIERFSEDIDLVVLRRDGDTDSRLKTKIKTISNVVSATLPEVVIEGITRKMGMNRKTAHAYNKEFEGNYGQVRDVIVLESSSLGYHEPYTTRPLTSFVGQMMLNNKQENLAAENGLLPFKVSVLEPTRTLCEKVMSLVRFSYGEHPIDDLKKKIRHTYDLHQLLQQKEFSDFFNSPAFDEMLLKVGTDDVASYRNNNLWLTYHPKDALLFKDLNSIWSSLKPTYNGDFKNLVYGNLPDDEQVFDTMNSVKERLSKIKWTVKINP